MTYISHSLLLGRSLLLGSRLLLGRGLLLRSGLLLGLGGLRLGAELIRSLVLGELAVGHGLLQGLEVHGVHPLLVLGKIGLHVLLDGDGGGSRAVLELRDGGDDSCFVRHVGDGV